MNYIITGADGLIGTFLKEKLNKKHKCVMSIDQRSGFNILDLGAVKLNPVTQHTDIVYHLAAHCKINEAIETPSLPHMNNSDGTFMLLEFCRKNGIKKVVNFSSSRVLSEEENPYTASKKYGENLMRAYYKCYGIEYITVRPSTVYGPIHDVTSRLLTTWCQNALQGKQLKIFGDENKTLDFTYVSDFIDAIELLTDSWEKTKNQEYNISGDNEVKLRDIVDMIGEHVEDIKFDYYPAEIAQPQKVHVDTEKMKKLGYQPKVKIKEGISKMMDFYKHRESTNEK